MQHPIGTGPFKWQERVSGDHITLIANESYFGDGPLLATVVYKYIPDLTVLFTQFHTGDIDYIGLQGISADHYDEAMKFVDRTVVKPGKSFIECFYFNLAGRSSRTARCGRPSIWAMTRTASSRSSITASRVPTETYLPQQSWAYNPEPAEA